MEHQYQNLVLGKNVQYLVWGLQHEFQQNEQSGKTFDFVSSDGSTRDSRKI